MIAAGGPAMFRSTLLASLAITALLAAPVIAEPVGTSTSCNGDTGNCSQTTCRLDYRGNMNCLTNTLAAPPPPRMPSKQEQRELACAARDGERQWTAHCTPEVYVDDEGVSRYRYAKPGCDVAVLSVHSGRPPWLKDASEQKCRPEVADR
jgi:hypothetical protein